MSEKNEGLQAVQADMKLLRDVRYWINHVLPPDQRRAVAEPGKKPSINEQLSWKIEGAKQREEQKRQQPHRQQNRIWNFNQSGACHFPRENDRRFSCIRRICLLNVFEAVKQSVTTRQAAEHYGVRVGRTGMCVCPFHDDKTPA